MFVLFTEQIAFDSLLFLSESIDLEVRLLVETNISHVKLTNLILFIFAVFFQFSDLEFILLSAT
jgi:hypothetical protein